MRNQFQEFCLGKKLEEIYGIEKAQKIKEKNIGKRNHFYGKHHTEKTKQILRNAFIGKKGYWFGKKNLKHSKEMKGILNPMKRFEVKEKHKLISNTLELRKKRRIIMLNYIKNTYGNFIKNIGKNEQQILDEIELHLNKRIVRQYSIIGYMCDGYIPELNLIIEIDEGHHNDLKIKEGDLIREKEIKKVMKCDFIRIPDYIRGIENDN
jgi:hypothetical protein